MRTRSTRLEGPRLIEPDVHGDARGFLAETYRADDLAAAGIDHTWVQDNHSRSRKGVLRGMHLQVGTGQAKLVGCARGAILDVVVDVRRGSPSYGEWEAIELADERASRLYVPIGFAHGFCVLTDTADVVYKCSSYYAPELERSIAYDDPEVGIKWPAMELIVSERDAQAPQLAEIADELPFEYAG